jgi:antitoxin ParD1/3/4
MPTRNVVLTERQEALIESLVRSGRYQNASEVLRDGLRLVESREAEKAARLRALRHATAGGIASIEQGEYQEFESIEDLKRHLDRMAEQAIDAGTE